MAAARSRTYHSPGRGTLAILGALGCLAFAPTASGAVIHVTTGTDIFDDEGACSLREAVGSANDDNNPLPDVMGECEDGSGADIIELQSGQLYALVQDDVPDNSNEN